MIINKIEYKSALRDIYKRLRNTVNKNPNTAIPLYDMERVMDEHSITFHLSRVNMLEYFTLYMKSNGAIFTLPKIRKNVVKTQDNPDDQYFSEYKAGTHPGIPDMLKNLSTHMYALESMYTETSMQTKICEFPYSIDSARFPLALYQLDDIAITLSGKTLGELLYIYDPVSNTSAGGPYGDDNINARIQYNMFSYCTFLREIEHIEGHSIFFTKDSLELPKECQISEDTILQILGRRFFTIIYDDLWNNYKYQQERSKAEISYRVDHAWGSTGSFSTMISPEVIEESTKMNKAMGDIIPNYKFNNVMHQSLYYRSEYPIWMVARLIQLLPSSWVTFIGLPRNADISREIQKAYMPFKDVTYTEYITEPLYKTEYGKQALTASTAVSDITMSIYDAVLESVLKSIEHRQELQITEMCLMPISTSVVVDINIPIYQWAILETDMLQILENTDATGVQDELNKISKMVHAMVYALNQSE